MPAKSPKSPKVKRPNLSARSTRIVRSMGVTVRKPHK